MAQLRGGVEPVNPHVARFWVDRPTLVTGGTGFVGAAIAKELVARGAQVVCLIRDWVPQSELIRAKTIEHVRVVRGDIRDRACIARILSEYEIDTVFHLAAQAIVGTAHGNPVDTFETNIAGTWCVLDACRSTPRVRQIIVASTDKAYGVQARLPYDEQMSLAGVHPYDVSKSCSDLLAASYAANYGLPVAITRCANLFGPGDLNFNRIIPGTIRHVLRQERPVIRSDGLHVRDYLYVEDATRAYLSLAEQLAERRDLIGEAFNFSNETRVRAIDLVRDLLRLMSSSLEPVILNQASNETRECYLSAKKARHVLGWSPVSSQDEALKRTIDWYRNLIGS